MNRAAASSPHRRIAVLDWQAIRADLAACGFATTGPLLGEAECRHLVGLYEVERRFRTRVVMARHGFGSGEYRYFAAPLPRLVAALRRTFYERLAPVARAWAPTLGLALSYPDRLEDFSALCRARGQSRPTPLLLRYGPGDYNCLHQDIYGPVVFPLQVTVLLSRPGCDFTGGEFLLVEQQPRRQSRGHVVPLGLGEAVIFATRHRPVEGRRGPYRAQLRHGVGAVRTGARYALGLIFHDSA